MGLVLRLVCEVLVSVSCVSRLPPVSFYRYSVCPGSPGVFLPVLYSRGSRGAASCSEKSRAECVRALC